MFFSNLQSIFFYETHWGDPNTAREITSVGVGSAASNIKKGITTNEVYFLKCILNELLHLLFIIQYFFPSYRAFFSIKLIGVQQTPRVTSNAPVGCPSLAVFKVVILLSYVLKFHLNCYLKYMYKNNLKHLQNYKLFKLSYFSEHDFCVFIMHTNIR